MIHKRGVWPVLLVLVVVILATGLRIAGEVAGEPGPPGTATPTPTPIPTQTPTGAGRERSSLVPRSARYKRRRSGLLCRHRQLVDPALIRQQNAQQPGCEAELEALMANEPPLRLTVDEVLLRHDLATATVTQARSASVRVDLIHDAGRWLLSFSDGGDPMPALAGSE